MLRIYRKLISLFPPRERRGLFWLVPAGILMAALQVVGIGSVMPFLAVVANPGAVDTNKYLRWLHEALAIQGKSSFMVVLGALCLAILVIANAVSALIGWLSVRYAEMRTHTLASRVLEQYLSQPYSFFLGVNSSQLGVGLLSDVVIVVSGMLLPGLQMISQSAMVIFLLALLLRIDPLLSVLVFGVLGSVYVAVYVGIQGNLTATGQRKADATASQFLALSEATGAIKDIKLLHLENVFLDRFKGPSLTIAKSHAALSVVSTIPHYALEVVAFGGILSIVVLKIASGQSLATVLPLAGLYGYAILRIKPALGAIYSSASQIRFNEPVLNRLAAQARNIDSQEAEAESSVVPTLHNAIEIRNLSFTYPAAQFALFEQLNVRIDAGSSVAFVGTTGSGKTSLADLILGLLDPSTGGVFVDDQQITSSNRRAWQSIVSYVPQNIYLADDTIIRNIAFGRETGEIDRAAVERAAKMACINDFVMSLPMGYESRVGENGVRISGGQRQRIGIARAFYREAPVLILDEATSALDGTTEEQIYSALKSSNVSRTLIVIAHRLNTVRDCDLIYMLEGGRVVASGSYDDLMAREPRFRAMARQTSTLQVDA